MLVAVYRWRIKPGKEKDFERLWEAGTQMFRDEQGALGSRLHRSEDGTYFAYAQWPDRLTYFAKKVFSAAHSENLGHMKECILESFPTITGEVSCDLLLHK